MNTPVSVKSRVRRAADDSRPMVVYTGGFVTLPNVTVNDPLISFKAKGLLAYLLGRPPGWRFAADRIAKDFPLDGRTSVLSGLRELEDAGYFRRTTRRNDAGQFTVTSEVAATPDLLPPTPPEAGFPTPVEPDPVEPTAMSVQRANTESQEPSDAPRRADRTPASRTPKAKREVHADQSSDGDEPTAYGADPVVFPVQPIEYASLQQAVAQAKGPAGLTGAARSATTSHACALRFKALAFQHTPLDGTNERALSATMKRWVVEGLSVDVLRAMVDTFCESPERYSTGREEVMWRAFINAREKLHADAQKAQPATTPVRGLTDREKQMQAEIRARHEAKAAQS